MAIGPSDLTCMACPSFCQCLQTDVCQCVCSALQFSLRCIKTGQLTGQSMLFRLWIDDLSADIIVPHQQTATQTIATQNAEQVSVMLNTTVTTEPHEQKRCRSKTVCCYISSTQVKLTAKQTTLHDKVHMSPWHINCQSMYIKLCHNAMASKNSSVRFELNSTSLTDCSRPVTVLL